MIRQLRLKIGNYFVCRIPSASEDTADISDVEISACILSGGENDDLRLLFQKGFRQPLLRREINVPLVHLTLCLRGKLLQKGLTGDFSPECQVTLFGQLCIDFLADLV